MRKINFALSLNLPATNYLVRVISDSKEPLQSMLTQHGFQKTFVFFKKTINRREEVELNYKGSSASIYSQIPIFLMFNLESDKLKNIILIPIDVNSTY